MRASLSHQTRFRVLGTSILGVLVFIAATTTEQAQRRVPPGGHLAVVADARLAALRTAPNPNAPLLRRLGRGRLVSIRGSQRTGVGLLYYRVAVNSRTLGWLQSEALIAAWHANDDERLIHLINGPDEFERVARAKIFLDTFPRSRRKPAVLLLYSQAAEDAAEQLTRSAQRQFNRNKIPPDGAPLFSYYLNYNGLDRYNRLGVRFVFDESTRTFHYDGAALREIVRRYPQSREAEDARKLLSKLDAIGVKK